MPASTKPIDDRPARLAQPVHLGQHVAEDVGQREQEGAAVGDDHARPARSPVGKAIALVAPTLEISSSPQNAATISVVVALQVGGVPGGRSVGVGAVVEVTGVDPKPAVGPVGAGRMAGWAHDRRRTTTTPAPSSSTRTSSSRTTISTTAASTTSSTRATRRPERPSHLTRYGDDRETLDERLAEEEPEVWERPGRRTTSTTARSATSAPAGWSTPTAGIGEDTDNDLVGEDVGIDGAGASAEEAAVHIVPD